MKLHVAMQPLTTAVIGSSKRPVFLTKINLTSRKLQIFNDCMAKCFNAIDH